MSHEVTEEVVAARPTAVVAATTTCCPPGPSPSRFDGGPTTAFGGAHDAVKARSRARGRPRARPWWEVYGPHRDDPAEVWTEVYYLLR